MALTLLVCRIFWKEGVSVWAHAQDEQVSNAVASRNGDEGTKLWKFTEV